jgi:hypothetical protein
MSLRIPREHLSLQCAITYDAVFSFALDPINRRRTRSSHQGTHCAHSLRKWRWGAKSRFPDLLETLAVKENAGSRCRRLSGFASRGQGFESPRVHPPTSVRSGHIGNRMSPMCRVAHSSDCKTLVRFISAPIPLSCVRAKTLASSEAAEARADQRIPMPQPPARVF